MRARPALLESGWKLATESEVKREAAREFLKKCESDGATKVEVHGRKRQHFWRDADVESGNSNPGKTAK